MILNYYPIFVKHLDVSPKTKQAYSQTQTWLANYQKDLNQNLTFKDLDRQFYHSFKNYIIEVNNLSPNYFGKHIKNIKSFMNWGDENRLHNNRTYKKYSITNQCCDEPVLNSEELKSLWKFQWDRNAIISFIEDHDKTRLDWKQKHDRFQNLFKHWKVVIALCSSGMYPKDLLNFSKDNIVNDRYVKYKRNKKTGFKEAWCIFPYPDDDLFHFQTVCEDNGYDFTFDINNLYRDIKVIMAYCGINKSVTARSFRKTFTSIWYYERGLEIQNVMKMTGHSRESSFKHYLNIDDDVVINRIIENGGKYV